jgi:hypothetical protein
MDLSFKGKETRENLNTFFEKMSALDKKLIQDGVDNSMTWLKKKYNSADVVEALFSPMVKYAKDKNTGEVTDKYPPTFKLKLPFSKGAFQCEAYDSKRNLLNLKELIDTGAMKGAKVTAIIQCQGIWVAGGKYGCSWKVVQMRVTPQQAIKGYAFKETEEDKVTDSDIDSDIDCDNTPVTTTTTTTAVQDSNVDNASDEEELLESSDDELDAPVTKTTKATARK